MTGITQNMDDDPLGFDPPEGTLVWGDEPLPAHVSWDDYPHTPPAPPKQRDLFGGERFLYERPTPVRVAQRQDGMHTILMIFAVRIDWR